MKAQRTTLISGFGINTERSHAFLPSTFTFCSEHAILACALIWIWPITKVRSLFSWRKDFQQAPWCASAEAGAAGFAGDTFLFVLTQTHHHVKDTGSRAEPFHPRCWPCVLLTELAHLYMVMCRLYSVWASHRAISSGFSWMHSSAWLRALMQHCLCGNNHCCTLTHTGGTAPSYASPQLQKAHSFSWLCWSSLYIFSVSDSMSIWLNYLSFQLS